MENVSYGSFIEEKGNLRKSQMAESIYDIEKHFNAKLFLIHVVILLIRFRLQ